MSDEIEPAGEEWLPGAKLLITLLGLAAGVAGGPDKLAAIAPALGVSAAMLDYIQDTPVRALRKVKVATDEAAQRYGDPDRLLARISEDERLLWQFDSTVGAASRAATDQKARALGRALANGALARDDAKIDEAAFVTRVLADLEPVDVRVLAVLVDLAHGRNVPPEAQPADERRPAHLYYQDLATITGVSRLILGGPLAALRRHGLVMDLIGGKGGWYATALGDHIIEYLREAPGD